jgi:electron transfer flavoprotein beta subunit
MRKIVVLAKQVPDTKNVGSEAMKADGTVNRAALPAIFNPEDLNALEMALSVKERLGMSVHVVTMGPPSAVTILKESLYRGADEVTLISDAKFAGADTLATSRVLAAAVAKLGDVAMVFAGRQAIDGDTAQVGPQVASLLGINLVGFVSKLVEVTPEALTVERDGETQTETIRAPLPCLFTVTHEANEPRFASAQRMLRYFRSDLESKFGESDRETARRNGWVIGTLDRTALTLPEEQCGLKGSPTKVFNIKNITLSGQTLELFANEPKGVRDLIHQVMKDYTEAQP